MITGRYLVSGFISFNLVYGASKVKKEHKSHATAKSLLSCLTLCDPTPGILQARILEWVAISIRVITPFNFISHYGNW